MADAPPTTDDRGGSRRVLAVVAVVVVALGLAVLLWVRGHGVWRMWAHGADREEYAKKILEEDDPDLVGVLDDVMRDEDQPDAVRVANARLLVRKNRLNRVEEALRDPRLDVRVVALRALVREPYFRSQYVEREGHDVRGTIVAWLRETSPRSRAAAAELVRQVWPTGKDAPEEVREALRAVLALESERDAAARDAAASTLASWGDCSAAPLLLARAAAETDSIARLASMQRVVQLHDAKTCADRLPEDAVRDLVLAALDWPGEGNPPRAVRMAALGELGRHPAWARGREGRLRDRLAQPDVHEVEQRSVFETLVVLRDPETLARFARWLHDPRGAIRAQAAIALYGRDPPVEPAAVESCLVGYLRREPLVRQYGLTVRMAYQAIRTRAGEWVGLPEKHRRARSDVSSVADAMTALFDRGAVGGTTRADVGEALWRWLAVRRNLAPDAVEAAVRARDEFWRRADAGDVAGAKAALEAARAEKPDLWAYEVGWLQARGAE